MTRPTTTPTGRPTGRPTGHPIGHWAPVPRHPVRVTARLTQDAELHYTTGTPPHARLVLHMAQPQGLPYYADVDLGTDQRDHLAASAEMPRMRRGALLSVAGSGLRVRTDHGTAALVLMDAADAVICEMAAPAPQPTQGALL